MLLIVGAVIQLAAPANASEPLPRAPLQNFITADDYPQGADRAAARPVGVSLTIGADGRVTECRVTSSGGNAALDAATCRLLRSRSRFTPARNAAGTPTTGTVNATIDWPATLSATSAAAQVRTQAVQPPRVTQAPWESISRLRVRLGQIGSCQWQSTGPVPPPPVSNACQNFALAGMALRMAAANKADFNKSEVVVTLRMPDGPMIAPLPASPAALVDLAAELDIGPDGLLTNCRFTRETVHGGTPQRPDCRVIFGGPYVPASRNGQPIANRRQAELRVEVR